MGDSGLTAPGRGRWDQCWLHICLKAQQPLLKSLSGAFFPRGFQFFSRLAVWEGCPALSQGTAWCCCLPPVPRMGRMGWQGAGQAPTGAGPGRWDCGVAQGETVGWHRGSVPHGRVGLWGGTGQWDQSRSNGFAPLPHPIPQPRAGPGSSEGMNCRAWSRWEF